MNYTVDVSPASRLDLNPGYLEVLAAKAVFLRRVQHFMPLTRLPEGSSGYMSQERAISCALAEVWRQGRRYQRDQDAKALADLAGIGKEAAV